MIALQHSIISANQKYVETPAAVPKVTKLCMNDSDSNEKFRIFSGLLLLHI